MRSAELGIRRGCIVASLFSVNPSAKRTPSVKPSVCQLPLRGSLLVQCKHGVQCRTPSRSDRFNGITGVARGPKGRNRNLPWPPGKKVIKMLIFYLFVLLPQSRLRLDSSLDREPFWRYLSSYVKPPSLREVDASNASRRRES